MARRSKVAREHFNYFQDVMAQIEWDLHAPVAERRSIPPDWHEIARDRAPKPKQKITLAVEEDVVKFFRSMGRGYQARMNDVLRAWMHGRLAELIDGPEAARRSAWLEGQKERPRIGDADLSEHNVVRLASGALFDLDAEMIVKEAPETGRGPKRG